MEDVLNDEMAMEAIEKVCEYLRESPMKSKSTWDNEKESAELARDLCYELLDASSAGGMCGCQLCQS